MLPMNSNYIGFYHSSPYIMYAHAQVCSGAGSHAPTPLPLLSSTRHSMASSNTHGTCAEHKLSVVIETDSKVQEQRVQRAQWLRAAILGANDGLVSTTSLMLGVGAAREERWFMILSGLAGAVAGACSMAVGEFASVTMQRDIEKSMGGQQNCGGPIPETITSIGTSKGLPSTPSVTPSPKISGVYQSRSPGGNANVDELHFEGAREVREDPSPARTPVRRLSVASPGRSPMMKVIIAEDVNPQKGLSPVIDDGDAMLPNPFKAAGASALSFFCGSLVPLVSTMFLRENMARIVVLPVVASIALVLFGGIGAYLGGSPVRVSAIRLVISGWIAMVITYGLLKPFDLIKRKAKHGDQQ